MSKNSPGSLYERRLITQNSLTNLKEYNKFLPKKDKISDKVSIKLNLPGRNFLYKFKNWNNHFLNIIDFNKSCFRKPFLFKQMLFILI